MSALDRFHCTKSLIVVIETAIATTPIREFKYESATTQNVKQWDFQISSKSHNNPKYVLNPRLLRKARIRLHTQTGKCTEKAV